LDERTQTLQESLVVVRFPEAWIHRS
jgi:hypothetical protein